MLAVDVCRLPETGGSMFVVVAGLFLLIAGLIVTRWVRASAGQMSVVVAPLVLLGGLVLAPSATDPCAPTTTLATTTTTLPTPTTTFAVTTTTTFAVTTTTTVAATTTTTAAPVVYSVGDTGPSGGIIFYVDRTRDEGSQYFEAACAGWSDGTCGGDDVTDPTAEWGCRGTNISGADGTAIGDGGQNTVDIMRDCSALGIAGRLAGALELGGQDDWFLPSKDELNEMYIQRIAIGGFTSDGYWSSSEFNEDAVWGQGFDDSTLYNFYKTNAQNVRPVRAF
jgi:hypothetical protein